MLQLHIVELHIAEDVVEGLDHEIIVDVGFASDVVLGDVFVEVHGLEDV